MDEPTKPHTNGNGNGTNGNFLLHPMRWLFRQNPNVVGVFLLVLALIGGFGATGYFGIPWVFTKLESIAAIGAAEMRAMGERHSSDLRAERDSRTADLKMLGESTERTAIVYATMVKTVLDRFERSQWTEAERAAHDKKQKPP